MPSQLSNVEREKIIQAFNNGTNIHSLASIFKVHSRTIKRIVNKFEKEGTVERKTGSGGHNSKRDHHFNLELKRSIRRDPTQSIRRLARERGVSARTVERAVAEDLKMRSYVRPVRHLVTPGQKVRRLERAKIILNKVKHDPGVIFYTDEKNFTQDTHTNRRNSRVLASDPHERDKNVIFKCKNPAKVMVFACVASDGKKMPLIMFEKAERLTGVRYVQVLKEVKTWILSEYPEARDDGNPNKINKDFKFTFQQDGAPCHTSAVAQKFLRDEFGNRFWDKGTWPPSSPDLNPLDFSIWNELVRKACEKPHSNLQALKNSINRTWERDIDEEFIKKACGAFRKRVEEVIAKKGATLDA
jgi:transposase